MNKQAIDAVYMFIAELNGFRQGNEKGKVAFGERCYVSRIVPEMSDDELHNIIWLERLYSEMDRYVGHVLSGNDAPFHWSVPIELDASALT